MTAVFWRPDPQIKAAEKSKPWQNFNRETGKHRLYFEVRLGFTVNAFTLSQNLARVEISEGWGATPMTALADAYKKSSIKVPAAEQYLPISADPLEGMFG